MSMVVEKIVTTTTYQFVVTKARHGDVNQATAGDVLLAIEAAKKKYREVFGRYPYEDDQYWLSVRGEGGEITLYFEQKVYADGGTTKSA